MMMGSPMRQFPRIKKAGIEGHMEEQVTSEFMKIMELIENQRNNKLNDNLTREAYRRKEKKLE